jgi:hypothetical protein
MNSLAKKENTDLTDSEESRLTELERDIKNGIAVFTSVGDALLEIRDGKLYRNTHGTFESYCRDKWQIGKTHAYQLINQSVVAASIGEAAGLSANADISEFAAREIKPHLAAVTEEIRTKVEAGADPVKTTYEVIEAKRAEIKAEPEADHGLHPDEQESKAEPLKSRGVGIQYAHEAIAVLKRIPLSDGLRQDAFDVVVGWIKTNRGQQND